jgi:hypothetical protein
MTMTYSRKTNTNTSTSISLHRHVQECNDLAVLQRTARCRIIVNCTTTRLPTPHVPAAKCSDRPDIRLISHLVHSFLSCLVTKHFQFNNSKKNNREFDVRESVHHSIINKENRTRCNSDSKFYFMFI